MTEVRANASYCAYQMSRGGERGRGLGRASFVPLSQQLYPRLREHIPSGGVGERARLETERELMETFGVSRTTVREAAPSHYGDRQEPVEYVEGVCHPPATSTATTFAASGSRPASPTAPCPSSAALSLRPADAMRPQEEWDE